METVNKQSPYWNNMGNQLPFKKYKIPSWVVCIDVYFLFHIFLFKWWIPKTISFNTKTIQNGHLDDLGVPPILGNLHVYPFTLW